MNTLTLKYGATEQSLHDWGFDPQSPILTYRSRAASTLRLTCAGADPAADFAIPFEGQVTFKVDGVVRFVGRLMEPGGYAKGQSRGVTIEFQDAWYDLEHTTYKQPWNTTVDGVTTVTGYSPRVYLFQKIGAAITDAWSLYTAAEQIEDILTFASTVAGVSIQAGTIDPLVQQPVTYMKAPSCAAAILKCIETLPDQQTWFDYTTTPPKLHIRARQNRTAVTLPWGNGNPPPSGTQVHLDSEIKGRRDLQVPQVLIQYQETSEIDGVSFTQFGVDAYPIGSDGNALRCLNIPVDLRGATRRNVTNAVTAATFDEASTDFWQVKKPDLGGGNITGLTVSDAVVTAPDGSDIDTDTYPNEFKNGVIASWMRDGSGNQIKVIEALVSAKVSYTRTDDATSGLTHNVTEHAVSTRIKLTNSPSGTTIYTSLASFSTAEPIILNLAYLYWCSVNNVAINAPGGVVTPPAIAPDLSAPENIQWEGTHRIIEQGNISTFYSPGNTLNIDDSTGGNESWATMAADIYEVGYDFFGGITTINFGPHKYLSADQFLGQMMMYLTRLAWEDPNVRSTGQDSSGGGTQIGSDTRLEDTNGTSTPSCVTQGVVGPVVDSTYWHNHLDAGSGAGPYDADAQWLVRLLNTSDQTQVSGSDSIQVKMSDGPGTGITIKLQKIVYENPCGTAVHRWFLCSDEIAGS